MATMRERIAEVHVHGQPRDVLDAAQDILREGVEAIACGLWRRGSSAHMHVEAHSGYGEELARTGFGKMDSGICRTVMEVRQPVLIRDLGATPDPRRQYPCLCKVERALFAKSGARAVLILPAPVDSALVVLLGEDTDLAEEDIRDASSLAEHVVRAVDRARDRLRREALVGIGALLAEAREISPDLMDTVARRVMEMVSAVGVSVFLVDERRTELLLAGTTGLVELDRDVWRADVAYPLSADAGLTPGVFLHNRVMNWDDLAHPDASRRLEERGFHWKHLWNEMRAAGPGQSTPCLMVPLVYRAAGDGAASVEPERIGVLRITGRQAPHIYFSPRDAEAACQVAHMLGQFVGSVRRAAADSLGLMQLIAHQFVSPLNALLWAVFRLEKDLKQVGEDRLPTLSSIRHLSLLAASYGNSFDLIARMWQREAGPLEVRPCRLAKLVVTAVRDYQPLALSRGVSIWMDDYSDPGAVDKVGDVMVNEEAFRHALTNVLDNAAKYGCPASQVALRALVDDAHVLLECTGRSKIGILPEDVNSVFWFRWQSPEARALEVGGTGSGMWLAREIMRRQGGDLTVEPSRPEGEGHRVVFGFHLVRAR